jgi:hypothetical protein
MWIDGRWEAALLDSAWAGCQGSLIVDILGLDAVVMGSKFDDGIMGKIKREAVEIF